MQPTNTLTAEAATRRFRAPLRPLNLIGTFKTDDGDFILLRDDDGQMVRLELGREAAGLTLESIADGWAMVRDGATLHRLIMA